MRHLCSLLLSLTLLCASAAARAQVEPTPLPDHAPRLIWGSFIDLNGQHAEFDATYHAWQREQARPLRLTRIVLEQSAMLIIGGVVYWINKDVNSRDWDVDVVSDELWRRFTSLELVSFDGNDYTTNHIFHAFAGLSYYITSRDNGLNVGEAFLTSMISSLVWEYVLEFREKVSVNDLVITSSSGLSIGELSYQLGEYYHSQESDDATAARAFTWIFGLPRTVHNWMDGVEDDGYDRPYDLAAAPRFTRDFNLYAGAQARQGVDFAGQPARQLVGQLGLRAGLVSLPSYERHGRFGTSFVEGHFNRFDLDLTFHQEGVADADASFKTIPLGYYSQDIEGEGGARRGSSMLLGVASEYRLVNRDHELIQDQLAIAHVLGPSVQMASFSGPWTLRYGLDVYADFTAARSLMWQYYAQNFNDLDLRTELRDQQYYFGWGGTLGGNFSVAWRDIVLGARLSWSRWVPINGVDRFEEQLERELLLHDTMTELSAHLDVPTRLTSASLRLQLDATQRDSQIEHLAQKRTFHRLAMHWVQPF